MVIGLIITVYLGGGGGGGALPSGKRTNDQELINTIALLDKYCYYKYINIIVQRKLQIYHENHETP